MKLANFERFSRAVVTVDDAEEFEEATDSDNVEKFAKSDDNLLVWSHFVFFGFTESAGECDVAS